MSKTGKNVGLIDANLLERRIRKHSLWNSEGVIEQIRLMPTIETDKCQEYKKQENKRK